jgi:hypothetical protein
VSFIGVGNDSFEGSNMASALRFEGQLRYVDGVNRTRVMQKGKLVILDSDVERSGFGFQALDANRLHALIVGNRLDSRIYAISLQDLGASRIAVIRNDIDAELDGVLVSQTPELRPRSPSKFLIARNTVRVNETGGATELDPAGGYGGISVFDFAAQPPEGEPPIGETFKSDITIYDNDVTASAKYPVMDGIDIWNDGTGDIRVINNRIRGAPFDSGIFVNLSRGTFIAKNDLTSINPPNSDIHLTETTRECRVFEPGDTVLDEGSGNRVRN